MATGPLTVVVHHLRRLVDGRPAAELTDAQLLERFAANREQAAFAVLMYRHAPLVWRVCRRGLRNLHDAEDAFQATFLVLARKAPSIRKAGSVGSWLYGVAHRTAARARDRAARRRVREQTAADLPGTGTAAGEAGPPGRLEQLRDPSLPDDTPAALQRRELAAALDEELWRLPDKYRLPLLLCHLEGHTNNEAAKRLGCPAGTLKSRLARGRQLLRARLRQRGLALPAAVLSVVLAEGAGAAGPSAGLLHGIVQAATLFAAGAETAGVVSGSASALATRMLQTMLISKLTMTALAVLALGLLGLGAGTLLPPTAEARPPDAPLARAEKPARTDLHDDPLPAGALARMGTVRGRHPMGINFLAFAPDGKTVVSFSQDLVLRVWDSATGREVRRFRPAPADLGGRDARFSFHVALSPDGKTLAATGLDTFIHLWDTATGKELRTTAEAKNPAAVFFSPDGKTLISRSTGGHQVQVWDLATGKETLTIEKAPQRSGAPFGLAEMAVSPDGKTLAAATTEGARPAKTLVTLYNLATGKEMRTTSQNTRGYYWASMRFSPDGQIIAWESDDGAVNLYDAATGNELRQIKCRYPGYVAFAFVPDGKTLLTRQPTESALRVWDVATGKQVRVLCEAPQPGDGNPTMYYGRVRLAVSRDGKTAAVTVGQSLQLIDLESGEARPSLAGHANVLLSVQYIAGGKELLTRSWEGSLRVWDAATGEALREFHVPEKVERVVVSPDGRLFAAHQYDRSVRVIDAVSGKDVFKIDAGRNSIFGTAFAPDGRSLAVRDIGENKLRIFDTAAGKLLRTFELPDPNDPRTAPVGAMPVPGPQPNWPGPAYSPDGRLLAVPITFQRLGLWDAATGKELIAFNLAQGEHSRGAAFTADGRSLAVEVSDGTVRLFEVATGKQRRRYAPKPGGSSNGGSPNDLGGWYSGVPGSLAFSPDGRLLAQGGVGTFVRIWDVISATEVHRFEGHEGWVTTVAFAPDGKTLATSSHDTTALVWDVKAILQRTPAVELSPKELAAHWDALAGDDAARAFDAVAALASVPEKAIPHLREQVRPAAPVDGRQVERLAADLDSDDFTVREKAAAALARLAEGAVPALEKVLQGRPPIETRKRIEDLLARARGHVLGGDALRELRAIEVLERAGTPEAREVLKSLAGGVPAVRLTLAAEAALKRLQR
jgi:RNA polymerase sigma factor (sigma-70 family)